MKKLCCFVREFTSDVILFKKTTHGKRKYIRVRSRCNASSLHLQFGFADGRRFQSDFDGKARNKSITQSVHHPQPAEMEKKTY